MALPELWPGADVQWIGPERERDGVRWRAGDRAVVVDPGRHGMTSFAALYHLEGARPPRPGRGVVLALPGGRTVTVPRRHLELVAPDHPLRPEPDAAAADWLLEQLARWRGHEPATVASFVPHDFPAVARVLHGEGPTGELDRATAAALVELLAAFTSSPDDAYVGVWIGWGDVPPQRFPGAAVIPTEGRGHFLLRGPVEGVLTTVAVSGVDRVASGIWWPSDRAWLVATEIDFEWTFVGGSEELVDRLLRTPGLEVTRTRHDSPALLPGEDATG